MFRGGKPAPANVVAWCILRLLLLPCASPTPSYEVHLAGNTSNTHREDSASQPGDPDKWLARILSTAEQVLTSRRFQDPGRRLVGPILPVEGWSFPSRTTLQFQSSLLPPVFGSGYPQGTQLTVLAGYRYRSILVEVQPGDEFGVEHASATFMLVAGSTTRDQCFPSPAIVPMAFTPVGSGRSVSPLGMGDPLPFISGGNALYAQTTNPDLVFMHGGLFNFCYTPDGSFGGDEYKNAILPVSIAVVGVYSSCVSNGCLEKEPWHCYFSYRAEVEGPCRIDIRLNGGRRGWSVRSDLVSRMLWSAAWPNDRYFDGNFIQAEHQLCSDVTSGNTIVPDESRLTALNQPGLPGLRLDREVAAIMPTIREEGAVDSFTVSACYCPNYDSQIDADDEACTHPAEYIQSIGVIYYWTVRVCDRDTWAACGVLQPPYARVVPHQPFILRLQCPPGGTCLGATQNRLKLIAIDTSGQEEKPHWDLREKCKTTTTELSTLRWLQNDPSASGVDESGGVRRDYKVWYLRYLLSIQTVGEEFDVCYCDDGCYDHKNYMQVGRIRNVESMSVARWTQTTSTGIVDPIAAVEFINKPGAITLMGGVPSPLTDGILPFDTVPFSRQSMLKLISFDREAAYTDPAGNAVSLERLSGLDRSSAPAGQRQLDSACGAADWSATLVKGPVTEELAKEFIAHIHGGPSSQRAAFSGKENDQALTVLQAGSLVVCYCAIIGDTGACDASEYWIAATRILVRGPAGGADIIFPTTYVVRVDIEGWGFAPTDTFRFIGMTQSCDEDGFAPMSSPNYRLGCPGLNATDCRLPSLFEDIPTFVDSSKDTGIYIEGMEIGDYNTTLLFSGDITKTIRDGDAITIDVDSVLLAGRNSSNWTLSEQFDAGKLTGIIPFADEPSKTHMYAQRVSYVYGLDGAPDRQKLLLPVGWFEDHRPPFEFVNGRGGWVVRNRLRTREELKADRPATLRMCWGASDGGSQKYYADAGIVRFVDPTAMDDAGVYFTSLAAGSVAPAMISFTPRPGARGYADFHVPTVLRLLFRDTNGKLEPLLTGNPSMGPVALDELAEVPMDQASQALCGQLFSEMWTNDVSGFPIPRGCYYSRQYQDIPASEDSGDEPLYREYGIVFEPRQGLKSSCFDYRFNRGNPCIYTLVLNARVGDRVTSYTEDIVSIFTACVSSEGGASPCGPRYSIIEYGAGTPRLLPAQENPAAPQLARVEMAPLGSAFRRPDVLELVGSSDGVDALVDSIGFEFRAYPRNPALPFQPRQRLQIFFLPLTIWNIGQGMCQAACEAAPGYSCTDGRSGHVVECQQEAVVRTRYETTVPQQKNSLYLRYPIRTEVIPGSAGVAHTLNVTGFRLPNHGFFPVQLLAQLRGVDTSDPSMAWISGSVFRVARRGTTSGRLLFDGPTGSGPRPFAGDRKNELLVRLVLGVTLQHVILPPPPPSPAPPPAAADGQDNDTDAAAGSPSAPGVAQPYPAPTVELLLPPGYECFIYDQGRVDPSKEIFKQDDNLDGFLDNYMSMLSLGEWTALERRCTFTLAPLATIHVGQVFFVRIRVDNPLQPFMRDDPLNVWYLSFTGTNMTTLGDPAPFISLAEEQALPAWCGNVAVIRTLKEESAQPSVFAEDASNELRVFFKAVDRLPENSYVLVDTPAGFDFTMDCQVSDLDVAYYADWHSIAWGEDLTGPRSRTQTLGDNKNCTSDQWDRDWLAPPPTTNFTRARVIVTRRLVPERFYGFSIRVRNAKHFHPSQHNNWRLFILSPEGYPVAGSKVTVQFNPVRIDKLPNQLYDRSWGVYVAPLLLPVQFDFNASIVLPSVVPIMSTMLTVHPFGVTTDGVLRSVRIIAPLGYEWDLDDPGDFVGSVPGKTTRVCEIFTQPYALVGNELILPDLVLRVGCEHGFQVRVKIPIRPPTRSVNEFFFEIGYDHAVGHARDSAGPVLAPPLRVIYDASIYSLCNVAGYRSNELEFHLRILSDLSTNDGFVFQGDESTRGTLVECWPVTVKGSLPLPPDAQCSTFRHPQFGLPMIILSAAQQTIPAGFYAFRFKAVVNPTQRHSTTGYWSLGTFGDVHLYPKLKVLDMASDVPAPRIRNLMEDAGLLTAPPWQNIALGRDDRPGAINKIVFYFRLFERPLFPPSVQQLPLALRGPLGFIFDEFCLDGITVLSPANPMNTSEYSNITGSFPCEHGINARENWCPSAFAAWPSKLLPVGCWGSGSSAMISMPNYAYLEDSMPQAPAAYEGFEAGVTYAFQVTAANPFQDYDPTKWALDFGHEASKPFSSFVLKTFDVSMTSLRPASQTVSSPNDIVTPDTPNAGFLPVNVQFRPSTELPASRAGLEDIGAPVPVGALMGSITLRAPTGFVFHNYYDGSDRTYPCSGIILEVAGYSPGDLEAKYRLGQDMTCKVLPPHFSELRITLTGAKVLRAGVPYRMVVQTKNPTDPQTATPWVLLTHMMKVGMDNEIPIDRITFTGFNVAPAIARWIVDNYSKEYIGDAEALSVRLTIRFTRPVLNGDIVRVVTASGVTMHAGGGLCNRFRWTDLKPPAWLLPLPKSPMPVCSCQGGVCNLLLTIMEGDPGLIAFQPSQELAFEVSALNPSGPPDVIDNFWMVQHESSDGSLIASGVVAGWQVYGQLRALSVYITGGNTRAGSSTDLGIEFTPAVWAGVMIFEVHEPPGFNFINCVPSSPLSVSYEFTKGARLVVTNGNFPAGQQSTIQLSQVGLGITGGQTRISILLFEELRQNSPVNRRLNFLKGFRAPGGLGIVEQRLWSQDVVAHHEGGRYDEVVPQLPVHSGQLARLDVFFNVTNDVAAGEALKIRSIVKPPSTDMRFQPRVDVDRPALLAACRKGESPARCTQPVDLGLSQVSVVVNQLDLFPYGLDLKLNATSPIEAARVYRLRFWCIPSQGIMYWSASTQEDNGALPTNTNDGTTLASAAVAELRVRVELFAARNPPQSVVPVRIVVFGTETSKAFSLVRVVMPRGYVRLGMQPPADPEASSRIVVNLQRSAGTGDPMSTTGWRCDMQIVTPSRNISDTRWFVLTSGPGYDEWGQPSLGHSQMLGWGQAPGFVVAALTVRFAYAGIPLFTGWFCVTFQLPTYARAKFVLIGAPLGFQLSCPSGANFFTLVCSRTINFRSASIGDPSRTINVTLPQGNVEGTNRLYVFMMGITTPENILGVNTWDMRVLDADLNTVDSALGVPGRNFKSSTLVMNPTLSWDREPMGGEASIATVEVTFQTQIRYIKALLISLPERYRHDIQHPNQFKSLNKHLPLAVNVEWRNYDNVRWVRLLLATTDPGGGMDFVPAGTFQFKFPVMIPVDQPVSMEWYFSMCASFECQSPDDEHVEVTFPIPNTRPILPARIFSGGLMPTTALTAGGALAARPWAAAWPLVAGASLWAVAQPAVLSRAAAGL